MVESVKPADFGSTHIIFRYAIRKRNLRADENSLAAVIQLYDFFAINYNYAV